MKSSFSGDQPQEGRRSLLPLLPLRDVVIFPGMVVPLFVGRTRSIAALDEAMGKDKLILLAAQIDSSVTEPEEDEIHSMGTISRIVQLLRLPDGTVKVLVEGQVRARVTECLPNTSFFLAHAEEVAEDEEQTVEIEALLRAARKEFDSLVKVHRRIPKDALDTLAAVEDGGRWSDIVASHLTLKVQQKQALLEMVSLKERLEKIFDLISGEIEVMQVQRKLRSRVKRQVASSQKEAYLKEQMSAIQKELGGERDEFKNELRELQTKMRKKKMSREATEMVRTEFKKLRMMSPLSAEAAVVRNYIETMISLPWFEMSEDEVDLDEAERILDEDHYGLTKVKERILEYLAVHKLVGKLRGPILCLVGPPGVGKTSVGKSVARASAREFIRMSLGGVRDEAEIRGHRRTYIGSMPGKIITQIKRAKVNNPVFLLDEVDKMSSDFRGDPTSALLEVLDPEQNHSFNDHYLDVDYDLSDVLFIATANVLHQIPPALRDRMEIIRLPGYTEPEKLAIAKRFLMPKQVEANGLKMKDFAITDGALLLMIRRYTREAGVRNLEREIASICRKAARQIAREGHEDDRIRVTEKQMPKYLGVPRFREQQREERDMIGIANGLAWTESGGELLAVEVAVMPGKGNLIVTGKLGEVMQESAKAALSYVRRRGPMLGLEPDFYEKLDIHVHVPEGAVPKDGPSAGIVMATAIASALIKIPVRCSVAMTGEVTLRGRVLGIGGLKEKLIAAMRAGVSKVLVPLENEKDLKEIPPAVRRKLEIVLVENMDEVLAQALVTTRPVELLLEEAQEHAEAALAPEDDEADEREDQSARLL
ncbi:MAG: endopeptidase La [Candidatus Lernaella stagnicola]|nr:endopeptidase La [Candidatus Lernaella stagnicola]